MTLRTLLANKRVRHLLFGVLVLILGEAQQAITTGELHLTPVLVAAVSYLVVSLSRYVGEWSGELPQ